MQRLQTKRGKKKRSGRQDLRVQDIFVVVADIEFIPEVVGSIPLAKAASGHKADPRLLQHFHAVKHVRLLPLVLTVKKKKKKKEENSFSP